MLGPLATSLMPTRPELLDLHDEVCAAAHDVMAKKSHDYAAKDDALFNVRQCEAFGLCSAEAGVLVRMSDKLSRLSRFEKQGALAVKDESVEDTVVDIVNYSVLLLALFRERKKIDSPPAC